MHLHAMAGTQPKSHWGCPENLRDPSQMQKYQRHHIQLMSSVASSCFAEERKNSKHLIGTPSILHRLAAF